MSTEAAKKYGFGTLAIVVISLLGFLGISLLPCLKKSFYSNLLVALIGLSISTIFCDAMLHILPQALGITNDEITDEIEIPRHVIIICVIISALYAFWIFEVVVQQFMKNHHIHNHNNQIASSTRVHNLDVAVSNKRVSDVTSQNFCYHLASIKPIAIMFLFTNMVHNFCDGLAVGASFNESIRLGISTSIAVICHEIPHELGDYAILVKYGLKHWQALFANFLTSIGSFIGFYIGISVTSDTDVNDWILAITAGMLLYIALVDLMPQIMFSDNWDPVLFISVNIFMWIGFIIMFLLVIFEDRISI